MPVELQIVPQLISPANRGKKGRAPFSLKHLFDKKRGEAPFLFLENFLINNLFRKRGMVGVLCDRPNYQPLEFLKFMLKF